LDGSKSCSVIVGHDTVAVRLDGGNAPRICREDFWEQEFNHAHPVPSQLEDLVIYELHVGGLGAGKPGAGTLRDAVEFVPHLVELGVNCVELMPINEFSGNAGWGYGQTHHLAFESSAGTLDDYRHFVRECHRNGIAVIQDVCYNHYDPEAERAQWQYDSTAPEHNCYYWYEGQSEHYATPDGGYVDNGSSGFAPRYHEEVVRQQFIASAALLLDECHVDGFRVDLTQALHRDNALHANGAQVSHANAFGQKLLREWSRTLRLLKPRVLLIAEDHTGWDRVTESPDVGGLGFSARWEAAFYHHLIGDSDAGNGRARLLHNAGFGGDEALDLFAFADSLYHSQFNRVVYHESHDEAGNAHGSARTLVTAVAGASLVGQTRKYAEARARAVFGLALFSAGTPLFFMGEEVGSVQPYRYNDFLAHRDDLRALARGSGKRLFTYYQDAIALRRRRPALRAQFIDVIHVNPAGRVIAFTRRSGVDELLVIVSLCNHPYEHGYVIQTEPSRLPDGLWREVLSSDNALYDGWNEGNPGAEVPSAHGRFEAVLPRAACLVFRRL
jgi:1,4-alpha-glucan branching enzyme